MLLTFGYLGLKLFGKQYVISDLVEKRHKAFYINNKSPYHLEMLKTVDFSSLYSTTDKEILADTELIVEIKIMRRMFLYMILHFVLGPMYLILSMYI